MPKAMQNRKQSPRKDTRKPNGFNIFQKANKGKLIGMSRSEISAAYKQSLRGSQRSVDSDEEQADEWMSKNTADYADKMRLDELAQFGTARRVSNMAKLNNLDADDLDDSDDLDEYDIENLSPETLLSLAPYFGIWDQLSEAQIQSIVDKKSGLTLNGQALMSSNRGRSSYRTPKAHQFVILPNGDKHTL